MLDADNLPDDHATRTKRDTLAASISDTVVQFAYYDRKEDAELPLDEIQDMIKRGEVSLDEIIDLFTRELREALS